MKDPAFLFYSSDFLSETILMSDEEIGQYIKLLCLQHQKGHLKEKDILNICKTNNEEIFSKFKKDSEGNYYNERLDEEIIRRKKYSESRRENRKKKITYEKDMLNICNSYEEHMGTETINRNITETENENKKIDNRGMGEEGRKEENSIENIPISEKSSSTSAKASKHKYGEYKHVLLKDEELQKLKKEYSNWEELIKYLDEYIEMKGYKAKSHYLCIKKWVVDAVKDKRKKEESKASFNQREYKNLNNFYSN